MLKLLCLFCTGSDAWKQNPTAVDAWSFGIILLELTAGKFFSWVTHLMQLAFQASVAARPEQLSRQALPANDAWFESAWQLIKQLLDQDPSKRPSMDVVLTSDFFTSDRVTAATINSTPTDRKFRMLNSHLDALWGAASRFPAHTLRIQSQQHIFTDMLRAFEDNTMDLTKAMQVIF